MLAVSALPEFVPGMNPLTLVVKGTDFSTAEAVLINGAKVSEFIIVNKQTIWAQMPANLTSISSIEVVSSSFTKNALTARIDFAVGGKTKTVSGILKLVQLFTKWVMQTPGSDIMNPTRGGGLQKIAGQVLTANDMQSIYATITTSIQNTERQIMAAQAAVNNLPLDETLMSAQMVDLNTFEAQMEARVRVKITNMTGLDATTALQL
jgi:hypothetical protein